MRDYSLEIPLVAQITFWLAVATPIYAYLGYPIALILLRRLLHRKVARADVTPVCSLIIPAYNENSNIERKLQNSLSLDYPAELFEILVACDGSKDGTPMLAKKVAESSRANGRIRVLDYPINRGKISVLNSAATEAHGKILVFTDASAILNRDALRLLVRSFADPTVGSVSGKYTVIKPDSANIGNSEDFYWKYETFLKTQEAELASTLGGHGHLHAIRADLYPFPPPGTINDDYIIHASVIAKGWRAVYEPKAIIREEAHEMTGFSRRVRIMAGNFQQLREIRPLLWPLRPLPLFFFLSRKAIRLVVPFALLIALAANLCLLDQPIYRDLFLLQAVFYVFAAIGFYVKLRPKFLMLPYYFSMINAAAFFGTYYAMTGMKRMKWK